MQFCIRAQWIPYEISLLPVSTFHTHEPRTIHWVGTNNLCHSLWISWHWQSRLVFENCFQFKFRFKGVMLHLVNYRYCFEIQIRSVTQWCPTLFDPMNHSTPGLPVHHQLPEFTQTHVHQVSDELTIQPTHPLSSPSPLAPNPSQHQSLFQWVNSSHEVTKVLDFQL